MTRVLTVLLLLGLAAAGCETTGGATVTFAAAAAGPTDARGGELEFVNGLGYHVVLTKAVLHIGALYLNQSVPSSGSQGTACVLPGIYVGEVLTGLDVDALNPAPQPFPVPGEAIALPARAGEVWLTGGDINTIDDFTVILDAEGSADRAGASYPFSASLTIGRNRLIATSDPALPSAHPICKQRIVSPVPVDFTPGPGGSLLLRVDPRGWFASVDFSKVPQISQNPAIYAFDDAPTGPADVSVYAGLHSRTGVYDFIWQP